MMAKSFQSQKTGFLKARPKAVADDRLIRRELYNPNAFDILVERDRRHDEYVRRSGIFLGPEVAILKADGFLVVPHMFLIMTAQNGAPAFQLLEKFGDSIGDGSKKASRFE